ncbi:MAG: tRNA (N6-isopentenyl adenosine(37)-C2)-methylthiotransferase MiaB [Acidobacteria bacterium]|nr:MAG: tRNA (N6-isopentenyl adenosine(37)-C2)-methylthiotransferase MiaB [Acidobacteriota bacterium]
MNKPFDVEIERLTAPGSESIRPLLGLAQAPERGTFFLETFGCQMNDHDSEKVAGVLLARGYRQVGMPDAAGLILYNTCSIREKAAQKVFSRLGEYRAKQSEGKIIGVLGCVAQQEGEGIFERAPWVSLVCGSASYRKLPELIAQLESGNHRVTGLELDTDETFETEITRRDNPFRAYLTIIEGWTVNSYADPTPRKMRFAELLLAVAEVPGIRRVRFTTSHPSDFTRDIVEAMEAQPKLCEHVHLPVQSGSTKVLRAMQRTYTRDEYLGKIAMIRSARRPIAITTDIIVGFPGESEANFEQTLSLLDEVGYDSLFSFKYSPRPNTPSLKLNDVIPEEEKSRRLAVLQDKQREIQSARNKRLTGETFEVLVSGKSRRENQWSGYTSSYRLANFTSHATELLGTYVQVRVTGATPNSLVGEHVV